MELKIIELNATQSIKKTKPNQTEPHQPTNKTPFVCKHIHNDNNTNAKKFEPVISIKKNESIDFVGHAKVLTLTFEV